MTGRFGFAALLTLAIVVAGRTPVVAASTLAAIDDDDDELIFAEPTWSLIHVVPPRALRPEEWTTTAEDRADIARLIEALTTVTLERNAHLHYAFPPGGFSPRADLDEIGWWYDWARRPTPPEIAAIVEFGPKAIPALLEALDDSTATDLVMRFERWGAAASLAEQPMLSTNRANLREQAIVERTLPEPVERPWPLPDELRIDEYTITRGDLCMVALGAIVNRPYSFAVSVNKYDLALASPTRSPEIAAALRELWSSNDPAGRLLDSLATDFATRGYGSESIQAGAWVRLLHWYPEQSVGSILAELEALPLAVPGAIFDHRADEAGLEHIFQIRVAALSGIPALETAAVRAVLGAADIGDVAEALRGPAVGPIIEVGGPVIRPRVIAAGKVPGTTTSPFRQLVALDVLLEHWPEDGVELLRTLVRDDAPKFSGVLVHRLLSRRDSAPWATELLLELLSDERPMEPRHHSPVAVQKMTVRDVTARALANELGIQWSQEAAPERRDAARLAMIDLLHGNGPNLDADDGPPVPVLGASTVLIVDAPIARVLPASTPTSMLALRVRDQSPHPIRLLIDAHDGVILEELPLVADLNVDGCRAPQFLTPQGGSSGYFLGDDAWMTIDLLSGRTIARVVATPAPGDASSSARAPLFARQVLVGPHQDALLAVARDGTVSVAPLATGEWTQVGSVPREAHLPPDWPVTATLIPICGTPDALVAPTFARPGVFRYRHATGTLELVPGGASGWRDAWGSLVVDRVNQGVALWDIDAQGPVTMTRTPDDLCTIVGTGVGVGARTLFALRASGVVEVWSVSENLVATPIAELELPFASPSAAQTIINGGTHLAIWLTTTVEVTDEGHTRDLPVGPTQVAIFDIRPWTSAR